MSGIPLDTPKSCKRESRLGPRPLSPFRRRPGEMLWAFFIAALAWLALGAVVGVMSIVQDSWALHWTAIHMLLLGGVSQLVLGAGQFFAGAFLATRPPHRSIIRAQLAVWNIGTAFVVTGVPRGLRHASVTGVVCIVAGLVLFSTGLRSLQRSSLQRTPWAVRWYQASAFCLIGGVLVGAAMTWPARWPRGSLLEAHLALNLGGWLGTAIIGTQHTFFPSLTQTRLRWRRLQSPTFTAWISGILILATGAAFGLHLLVVLGWVLLSTAGVLISINLAASWHAGSMPRSLPARLLFAAHWLGLAGLLTATVHSVFNPTTGSSGTNDAIAILILAGWIGLTVMGALLHLLAVVARIRGFAPQLPRPYPRLDRALTLASAAAVATWATGSMVPLDLLATAGKSTLAVIAALFAARIAKLASRAAGIGT